MTLGFVLPSALAHRAAAFLWFVFLGPGLCLQLPLHLASRRRSCCSARSSCHQGLQRTFTSKSLPNRFSPPWLPAPVRRCAPCPAHSRSGGESHPSALTEPDVKLSPHPAPTIQPPAARRAATGRTSSDPVARCPPASASRPALGVAAVCTSVAPIQPEPR